MDYSSPPSLNFNPNPISNSNPTSSNPPSMNFDFSNLSFDNQPTSPSVDQSIPQNNNVTLVPVSSSSTPNVSNSNSFNSNENYDNTLSSVQQRMEQMKLNQQNLKRLQEERKKEEENLVFLQQQNKKEETQTQSFNSSPQQQLNNNSYPTPSVSQPKIPEELLNSMNKFMNTVDNKLQNMENQLRKLTLDFHQACSKQEQNTQILSERLNSLKSQLEDTRSTVISSSNMVSNSPSAYPKLTETSSMSSPFTPPSYNSVTNSQQNKSPTELADEALAKKLQEEYDNEQKQQQSRSSSSHIQPPTFNSPQLPSNNSFIPPSSVSSPYQQQTTTEQTKENCPVCGLAFTVGKELTEHANTHFEESQPQRNMPPQTNTQMVNYQGQQRYVAQPPQQQNNQGNNNNEPGFFAKIFGAKPKPQTPQPGTTYYSQPPQTQTQNQPRVQYYNPTNQMNSSPQQGQQVVYYAPNGTPIYPQQQPR